MTIELDGTGLTIEDLVAVARHGKSVELAPSARHRMKLAREVVEDALASGEPVYGLTTGVAERKRVRLRPADRQRFNQRLVLNHRVAQGEPAPPDVIRGAMLCLASSYAKGVAGVRPELCEMIIALLNEGFVPRVRRLGSVGQSDLGPMADLAHGLLTRSGFQLAENEGLALINSNAFATAWAALALADTEQLLSVLDVAAALDLEAFEANLTSLHPIVSETRPFPGIRSTLDRLRSLLEGSHLWAPGAGRNLQDPLTFRCIPQIHGAARDTLDYARAMLELQLNSSQSNPVVVLAERRIVSVGNFDIGPVAAALDFVRIALAPVVTSANERAVKLLQSPISGLPAGLAADPESADDALAELAAAGQALTVEARMLALPVSYELASTTKGEGIEDRTTMAPLSARRLADMIQLGSRVAAIELVVAAQAIDLRASGQLGRGTQRAHRMVRALVPFTGAADTLPAELEPVVDLVARGDLARTADAILLS
jgi:histidine ammonia-lyase